MSGRAAAGHGVVGTALPGTGPGEPGLAVHGQATHGEAARGPAVRGPAIRGPAVRGPAIRGPAARGPAARGPAAPAAHSDTGTATPPPAHPRPASLTHLFIAFTLLALQGFGGVLAVVQRELVERRRWLSQEEFLEDWAVAQIMPGPNVVNLAMMIGARYFGLRGALAALAGMLTLPLLVVLALVTLHARFADNPQVAGALRGMAAVSAGLIAAAGLKMSVALRRHPLPFAWSAVLCTLGFVLVALLKWPLAVVLLGLGGLGCILTWRRLT